MKDLCLTCNFSVLAAFSTVGFKAPYICKQCLIKILRKADCHVGEADSPKS